jgi:hypothetical protein
VHEKAEDVDEGEGGEEGEGAEEGKDAEEGEQQEEEEGDSEGEQASKGYVVTSVIDKGEENPEVMRQYQRSLKLVNVHWKRTLQMMMMMIMCPCIGETTISPGVLLILVRMCHGSTRRMRFV